jgi:hypothetical protein
MAFRSSGQLSTIGIASLVLIWKDCIY